MNAGSVDVWRSLVLGMSLRATAIASAGAVLERAGKLGHGGADVMEMIHRACHGLATCERDIEALAVRDRVVQPIAGPFERSCRIISRG